MTRIRYDNSVLSANDSNNASLYIKTYNSIYRAMILEVYYIDHKFNVTTNAVNPQVIYDVIFLGGEEDGQIITNVRASTSGFGGGQYNYKEKIYRKNTKDLLKSNLEKANGDIVYIAFLAGDKSAPIILSDGIQMQDLDRTGATQALGPRLVEQYNGVYRNIDKDGNFYLTRKGGIYTNDYFVPRDEDAFTDAGGDSASDEFKAKLHLHDDTILLSDYNSSITFDNENKKITIDTGLQGGNVCQVVVDSTNDQIKLVDGSGATLNITAGKIGLGQGSNELFEILSDLCNTLSTDLGNLGYPLANSAQYAALKAKIDAIKGSI